MVERLRIDSSGSVGIGTDDPTGRLEINTASSTQMITLNVSNANFARIGHNSSSGVAVLDVRSEGHIRFLTDGNNERLRITNDGPHLLLGGTDDVNEITESSSNAGMVIGGTGFGNGGIAIINSTSGTGRIYFGDAVANNAARNRGQINYYHNGDYMMFATAGSESLRITAAGGLQSKGNGGNFEQVETNPYDASLAQANGKITIKGDLSGGNYFGWRQKGVGSGSVTDANAVKKLPTVNDFTYPNSSNGMLFASTSKIGFSASAESPQFANGVTMLFDASGLAIGNNNAFDCNDTVSNASTAKIRLLGSGKVSIGTTDALHSSGDNLIVGSGSGEEGMSIYSGTTSAGVINFADGNSSSDRYDGRILYNHGSSPYMRFHVGGGTERLRINSNGVVSISTAPSSGTGLLNIKPGSADTFIKFRRASDFDTSFDGTAIDNRNSANNAKRDLIVRFGKCSIWAGGNSDTITIESDGQVNVNGPGTKYTSWAGNTPLNVASMAMVNVGNADTNNWGWGLRGNSGDTQWCLERIKDQTSFADVNIKFRVYQNGNYLFAGSDQSDRDIKENILDISGTSLDKIKQLKPRTFNFIESEGYSTETKTGFIAQEVASVIPSITNGTDGQKNMGVDYNGLVAHLVKALQEATTEIETLKTKVAALEGS